jgi:exosome complex RNA-binding protein Csl4
VAEELVDYFRERGVAWAMCIALPYHATSCAAIVLQVKHSPASPTAGNSTCWSAEDIEQLEEISAQGEPSTELVLFSPALGVVLTVVARGRGQLRSGWRMRICCRKRSAVAS